MKKMIVNFRFISPWNTGSFSFHVGTIGVFVLICILFIMFIQNRKYTNILYKLNLIYLYLYIYRYCVFDINNSMNIKI